MENIVSTENSEEIVSRLKFIGCLQKDEKINVKQVTKSQYTGIWSKIQRMVIYPDNRRNTLKFLRDVISRSFEIIEYNLCQENRLMCKSIIADFNKARQGMLNLKYTYSSDTKFCCDIEVLMENISSKINSMKEKHPDLFDIGSPISTASDK